MAAGTNRTEPIGVYSVLFSLCLRFSMFEVQFKVKFLSEHFLFVDGETHS